MSHSAHTDEYYMKEHFDDEDTFNKQVDELAELVQNSKHFIVFSGAGVSTSAGIPDFRGPNGTWTLKAQNRVRTEKTTSTIKAYPTLSHMSLVELQNQGVLKYMISQNCDGLHRRSGIHPNNISELHGNGTIEYCEDCGRQYPRDFHCTRLKPGRDHYTGRHCVVKKDNIVCNGRLLNSTIDFGQDLPLRPLELAYEHARKADLCLVLGSSLTVSPANEMPKIVGKKKNAKLVICNLQKTPLEKHAHMNIHAKCDDLMEALMSRLGVTVPKWKLERKVQFAHLHEGGSLKFLVKGVDRDDVTLPSSIFTNVQVTITGNKSTVTRSLNKEPFLFTNINLADVTNSTSVPLDVTVKMGFYKHYQEPEYEIKHTIKLDEPKGLSLFTITFRPDQGDWEHEMIYDKTE